jgi:MoaA/NifB/PqqE/SkfB family radical SAM enzyme
MPQLVNLEFTKKCNASCSFCTCWQVDSSGELNDYGPIVKMFRPVVLSISGGEPLLRKNYDDLIRGVRPYCHYLSIITNGALLNAESAKRMVDAGMDQISVSLDYLSDKHDKARVVEGLYDHISEVVPALASDGYRLSLNTVIMESNLEEIIPIAYKAKEWGIDVSFSAYCDLKGNDESQMIQQTRYAKLIGVVDEIMKLKGKLGNIKNSNYYLTRLKDYFRDGGIPNCMAGSRWVQVTPDGYIQQCSELPRLCHYTEYSRERLKRVSCTKCWYTCRGELEANPLAPDRLKELIKA